MIPGGTAPGSAAGRAGTAGGRTGGFGVGCFPGAVGRGMDPRGTAGAGVTLVFAWAALDRAVAQSNSARRRVSQGALIPRSLGARPQLRSVVEG